MSDPIKRIADAVLYEGYVLWPYRRSALKNRQRWTFGGVYPAAYARATGERSAVRAEVLVEGCDPRVEVEVRFLHYVRRGANAEYVEWDEAIERTVRPGPIEIAAGRDGGRSWERLDGRVSSHTEMLAPDRRRIAVEIENTSSWDGEGDREQAMRRTLCSAHAVLRVEDGAFVSPLEAEGCRNEGLWPCLVGEPPDRNTILASPIILDEYPQIAPESPGDLFDGGEIDELLILNVLALTDAEREEVRASDPRVRELLDRCERLTPEALLLLHGAVR